MSQFVLALGIMLSLSCQSTTGARDSTTPEDTESDTTTDTAGPPTDTNETALADVIAVRVDGSTFSVTLRSPDQGCDQYANWWEVLRPDGTLVHRRILGHSHVDEQPFTRSSSPVDVVAGEELIVRAHMHPGGYGGTAMRGSVDAGFEVTELAAEFAGALATTAPLPESCAF